ncbi:MAG: FAD-dependent oxidoreductase [Kofleriaceae bacterium]|nr:FAD-dependent oxidoreductase [Kofleriaceae bacterium]
MSKERAVIVGASLAGVSAADSMRQHGFDGHVVMIGAEAELPYHRPPLSKEMLGVTPIPEPELRVHGPEFFEERAVELHLGTPARALDAGARTITLSNGRLLEFDKLLIATGASPRRLDMPGMQLGGVHHLRTLEDSRVLRTELQRASKVVVIGAGLLGFEVAAAARELGREVTVLERGPSPLRRAFHAELAELVTDLHRRHGVDVRTNTAVVALEGDRRVQFARLADGTRVHADVVVVAAGVDPNTAWLRGSGVTVSNGVIVNELGQTVIPGIYAAGDVARVYSRLAGDHVRFEQYAHAREQGVGVGRVMAGASPSSIGLPSAATVAYGVRAQSVGFVRARQELVTRGNRERRTAFLIEDGHVAAAFAFDRARDFTYAKRLVMARANIRRELLADDTVPLAELAGAVP